MTVNTNRKTFLHFCGAITGYSPLELEGTGLVDDYQELLEQVIGQALVLEFYNLAAPIVALEDPAARDERIRSAILPSSVFWPIVANLISLWYLGFWNTLPDSWYTLTGWPKPGPGEVGFGHVPSAKAYIEQLSYRTAGAHTPGAKPTGFGSWAIPPVF